jgi:hypothetical protein
MLSFIVVFHFLESVRKCCLKRRPLLMLPKVAEYVTNIASVEFRPLLEKHCEWERS